MKVRNRWSLAISDNSNTFLYLPNSPVDDHSFCTLVQLQLNILHVHTKYGYPLCRQLLYVIYYDAVIFQCPHDCLAQKQVVEPRGAFYDVTVLPEHAKILFLHRALTNARHSCNERERVHFVVRFNSRVHLVGDQYALLSALIFVFVVLDIRVLGRVATVVCEMHELLLPVRN